MTQIQRLKCDYRISRELVESSDEAILPIVAADLTDKIRRQAEAENLRIGEIKEVRRYERTILDYYDETYGWVECGPDDPWEFIVIEQYCRAVR